MTKKSIFAAVAFLVAAVFVAPKSFAGEYCATLKSYHFWLPPDTYSPNINMKWEYTYHFINPEGEEIDRDTWSATGNGGRIGPNPARPFKMDGRRVCLDKAWLAENVDFGLANNPAYPDHTIKISQIRLVGKVGAGKNSVECVATNDLEGDTEVVVWYAVVKGELPSSGLQG